MRIIYLVGAGKEDGVRDSGAVAVHGVGVHMRTRMGVNVDHRSAPEIFTRRCQRDGGCGYGKQELTAIQHETKSISGTEEKQASYSGSLINSINSSELGDSAGAMKV
jgi:hypothetical protein